jgi:hypothetical protein
MTLRSVTSISGKRCGPRQLIAASNGLDGPIEIYQSYEKRFVMPGSPVKVPRVRGPEAKGGARSRGRAAATILVKSGASPDEEATLAISVRPETVRTLGAHRNFMGALMETYSAAVEKSRQTGRAVSFIVDVGPRGKPTISLAEDGSTKAAEPVAGASEEELAAALAVARDRGQARVAEILRGRDMLSAEEFAELIGTSRVTVNAKRQNHQVLALEGAKRGYRFPSWQVGEDGKPFSALPELFDRLGGNPWTVYRFLVQRHPELDDLTGREALSRGRTAEVLEVAESTVRAAN